MNPPDLKILERYRSGKDVDPEDMEDIGRFCLINYMKKGISLRGSITAKTLPTGIEAIT